MYLCWGSQQIHEMLGHKYSTCFFNAAAMERLASCYHPSNIGSVAYKLYEDFRPDIPDGVQGWGAKGLLDLSKISLLAVFVKTNMS